MPEPSEPRPYPPPTVWRFPPPPVSRIWLVAAIVGGLLGLVAAGAAITFLAVNAERDIPGFIDDPRVIKVAKKECRLMTRTVKGLETDGRPGRLETLLDQNTAVTTMVNRIRAVPSPVRDADEPVDAWLEDWEILVAERAEFVRERRRGGEGSFRVPRTPDGDPIHERMDLAGEEVCSVPKLLLKPQLAGTSAV